MIWPWSEIQPIGSIVEDISDTDMIKHILKQKCSKNSSNYRSIGQHFCCLLYFESIIRLGIGVIFKVDDNFSLLQIHKTVKIDPIMKIKQTTI